jgi:hypothetical protein
MPTRRENLRIQQYNIQAAKLRKLVYGTRIALTLQKVWRFWCKLRRPLQIKLDKVVKQVHRQEREASARRDQVVCTVCMGEERSVLMYARCGHSLTMPICLKCLAIRLEYTLLPHKRLSFKRKLKSYTGCGCYWDSLHSEPNGSLTYARALFELFCNRNQLVEQLLNAVDDRPYMCNWCDFFHPEASVVYAHVCNECPNFVVKCPECQFMGTRESLSFHRDNVHVQIPCSFCGGDMILKSAFRQHIQYHADEWRKKNIEMQNAFRDMMQYEQCRDCCDELRETLVECATDALKILTDSSES